MKKLILFVIAVLLSVMSVNAQYTVTSIPYNPFPYNSGTPVLVSLDDLWSNAITLPFAFNFFGINYDQLVIGSNGLISFDTANAGNYCAWSYTVSCPDPTIVSGSSGPYIFSPYHDVDPSINGNIYYAVLGTYPNREFVVSWDVVPMFSCNSLFATQQIVLYETSNDIDIYILYKPICTTWNSGNAVIGIQDTSGTIGFVPPGRNTGQWTATNEAWRFHTGFIAYVNNITNADCNTSNGAVYITVAGGIQPYTFLWNSIPPQTTQNLAGVPSGYYCVTVYDSIADSTTVCAIVDTAFLSVPDICMATVDSSSGYNEIIWEKPVTSGIDKYIIYRETSISGVYAIIGSQNYSNYSTFIDSSSIPLQQSYRYKIAILDYCSDTTLLSPYHQTVHLTVSSGTGGSWNLLWNDYLGFSFNSYNIYRGTDPQNMTLLNSVASSINSYTDLTPPSGNVYYLIEAVKPTPCNPSLKSGNSITSTISNIASTNGVGINEISDDGNIQVYPNPAKGTITISGSSLLNSILEITNSLGQKIYSCDVTSSMKTIDIYGYPSGIYFLSIKGNAFISYKKFMIE